VAPRCLVAIALVTGACSTSADRVAPAAAPPERTTLAPTTSTTSTTSTTVPTLPPPQRWAPSGAEPVPNAKSLAARVIEAIGTYPAGAGTVAAARDRLAAADLPPALADGAAALLRADAAGRAEVVYPQLGGLTETQTSIVVVARLDTLDGDGVTTSVTRTVDVRLERGGGPWRATGLTSDGGSPPASPPAMPPAVTALLEDDRVELPSSAVWDLQSGATGEAVALLLTTLSKDHELRVTVLATGHPMNVFATDRLSNHTAGRAVDIWAVDGIPVVDQQQSPVLRAVVDAALAAGATEVGAPFDVDGPGGRVFTNTVHLDHLHLAFRSG